jgi:hypothetical protein
MHAAGSLVAIDVSEILLSGGEKILRGILAGGATLLDAAPLMRFTLEMGVLSDLSETADSKSGSARRPSARSQMRV